MSLNTTLNDFRKEIESIPVQRWEQSLPIGNFRHLHILKITKRPYSYVARCRLTGSDSETYVHAKYYQKSNISEKEMSHMVEQDFQRLSYWNDKFRNSDRFGVVKPLFTIPEKSIIITKEIPGQDLLSAITKHATFFSSQNRMKKLQTSLRDIGHWLKYFQSLNPEVDERFSIDDFADYLDVRLKILGEDQRRHFPDEYGKRIRDYISQRRNLISDEELKIAYCHGDFNLGNVIANDNRVTGLDFGAREKSSFLLDVSRIYHQLFLFNLKPQFRFSVIRELQKALLEGFGSPEAERLMIFRFLLVRHTLTHLVGITRFWQKGFKERLYNYWVLWKELSFLDSLLR